MRPLLSSRLLRAVGALGLVAAAWVALVASGSRLLWLLAPSVFLVVLVTSVAAPFVAIGQLRGAWSAGRLGQIQRVASVVVLVLLVSLVILAVMRASDGAYIWRLGAPTESDVGFWLVIAGAGMLAAAVLISTVPQPWSREPVVRVVLASALLGLTTIGTAGVVQASMACSGTRVDATSWRAAREDDRTSTVTRDERLAAAIVECGALDGLTRAEVRRKLGSRHDVYGRDWHFGAGWVNDGIGPGDEQALVVHFNAAGRVSHATLLYPPE